MKYKVWNKNSGLKWKFAKKTEAKNLAKSLNAECNDVQTMERKRAAKQKKIKEKMDRAVYAPEEQLHETRDENIYRWVEWGFDPKDLGIE